MNKVLSKKVSPVILEKLKNCGYFAGGGISSTPITGSIPEDKRSFLIRSRSSWYTEETEVPSISDVIDWLREIKNILAVIDICLNSEEEVLYCGKVVNMNTMTSKLDYSSPDYESVAYSVISKALEELC